MIIKTKYYRLEKGVYRRLAMRNTLKRQWWVGLIGLAICLGYLWIPIIWWFIGAFVGVGLYFLFWWIQFYGVTQLEQSKMLFQRLAYEINSRQVLIKVSAREGMPMKWEQIKRAEMGAKHFLLIVNRAQLIHLPFRIFNSENERKFLKSILKSKRLLR